MAAASARAVERSLISKADGREADSGLGVGGGRGGLGVRAIGQ